MGGGSRPVRVAVVDDEPDVVELLTTILGEDDEIEIVARGSNGHEALRIAGRFHPDLMTIDIAMPRMDGLRATREIMRRHPTRIMIITGLPSGPEADLCYQALGAGAVDFLEKPLGPAQGLRTRVKALASEPLVTPELLERMRWAARPPRPSLGRRPLRVVGIGGSSAGPPAVASILSRLPPGFSPSVAVVQRLPSGFEPSFADFLKRRTSLRVSLVTSRAELRPATVFLAPANKQLVAEGDQLVAVEPTEGEPPSLSRTFESLADTHREEAAGIVLSGVGDDGAEGIRALRGVRGLTIAQERISAAVAAMPRAAIDQGGAELELPLEHIAPLLVDVAG